MTDTCDAPSYSRYVHNRCPLGRCPGCTEANRLYQRERPKAQRIPMSIIPGVGGREYKRADWMEHGDCRHWPVAVFYPGKGDPVRLAKDICAECAVRRECLDHALDTGEHFGIWGGKSERERRMMRRDRRNRGSAA